MELTVTAVLVTNIFQYGWWRCKLRKGDLTHWQKWDAAYFLALAMPLNVGMPLAVVIIYIGEAGLPESKMWHSGSWVPNTPHGIFLYLCKWLGVGCLTVGVAKATQILPKLRAKWQAIRNGRGTRGTTTVETIGSPAREPSEP